jgi:Arc/MetJ-type ribon-helix-helix transcriptional regulator
MRASGATACLTRGVTIDLLWNEHIITDMKIKSIVLTDELAKELESYPNQSEVIRTALQLYNGHITPEVLNGLRLAYEKLNNRLANIETAMDKIAQAGNISLDRHSEWGA